MAVLKVGDLIFPVGDYQSASISLSTHAFATISHTHHTDRPPPEQTGGSPLEVKLAVKQLSNLATGRTFRTRILSIKAMVELPISVIHHDPLPYKPIRTSLSLLTRNKIR